MKAQQVMGSLDTGLQPSARSVPEEMVLFLSFLFYEKGSSARSQS